jgi:hypothetical protein
MTSSVFFYRRYSKDVNINIINERLPIFVYAAVAERRKHHPVPGASFDFSDHPFFPFCSMEGEILLGFLTPQSWPYSSLLCD